MNELGGYESLNWKHALCWYAFFFFKGEGFNVFARVLKASMTFKRLKKHKFKMLFSVQYCKHDHIANCTICIIPFIFLHQQFLKMYKRC